MSDPQTSAVGFVDYWTHAEWRADITALGDLLDEEFVAVGPEGAVMRKAAWLDRYRRGDLVHHDLRWSTALCVSWRHVAVMTGQLRMVSSYQGHDTSGTCEVMLVVDLEIPPRLLGLHIDSAAELDRAK